MVFDEFYYKENNVGNSREERKNHHEQKMEEVAKEANYRYNSALHELAHEHFIAYCFNNDMKC